MTSKQLKELKPKTETKNEVEIETLPQIQIQAATPLPPRKLEVHADNEAFEKETAPTVVEIKPKQPLDNRKSAELMQEMTTVLEARTSQDFLDDVELAINEIDEAVDQHDGHEGKTSEHGQEIPDLNGKVISPNGEVNNENDPVSTTEEDKRSEVTNTRSNTGIVLDAGSLDKSPTGNLSVQPSEKSRRISQVPVASIDSPNAKKVGSFVMIPTAPVLEEEQADPSPANGSLLSASEPKSRRFSQMPPAPIDNPMAVTMGGKFTMIPRDIPTIKEN